MVLLHNNFLIVPIIFFLSLTGAKNPLIKEPIVKTYEVDQDMTIEWNPKGTDTLVTIDVINDRPEVLIDSYIINTAVSKRQGSYLWKIPRFLKSSVGYHVRVYEIGQEPKKEGDAGYGQAFSILNSNPLQQSTLMLLEPSGSVDGVNLESTCLLGEQCLVRWDYPSWAESAIPKSFDIKLYSAMPGTQLNKVIAVLAQGIPSDAKEFKWHVPLHDSLKLDKVYVGVMGSGKMIPGPGVSCYLATSGYPFRLESRKDRNNNSNVINNNNSTSVISIINTSDTSTSENLSNNNNDNIKEISIAKISTLANRAIPTHPTTLIFLTATLLSASFLLI